MLATFLRDRKSITDMTADFFGKALRSALLLRTYTIGFSSAAMKKA
jgi:hypothetical protein